MSSTLMSTDMNITRSTTRRHAPPGGTSSIVFGDDSQLPSGRPPVGRRNNRPETAPPAVVTGAQPPVPPAVSQGGSRSHSRRGSIVEAIAKGAETKRIVGIAISTEEVEVYEVLRSNCKAALRSAGLTSLRVFEVPDAQQLPAACEYLLGKAQCDGVVALGALLESSFGSGHLASSLSQSLSSLSSALGSPVVPGLLLATDAAAARQAAPQCARRAANGLVALLKAASGELEVAGRGPRAAVSAQARATAAAVAGGGGAAAAPGVAPSTLDLLGQLRESLKAHGATGILSLGRKFRIMDDDMSGDLSLAEFQKAVAEHTMGWTEEQVKEVFDHFDEDGSGGISYDEFLYGVRGDMNERRSQLCLEAFAIMDTDKSGAIETSDLIGRYSAREHPEVKAGKKTEDEVLTEFLATFECGEADGKVTPDEWLHYYAHVSMSVDDDDYFELMIRNAWHMSGGEGWCANTSCRRVLVTHTDGRQTVEEIKNDLGIGKTDIEAMMKNLAEQGITDVASIDTSGNTDQATPEPAAAQQPPAVPTNMHGAPIKSPGRRQPAGGASSWTFG